MAEERCAICGEPYAVYAITGGVLHPRCLAHSDLKTHPPTPTKLQTVERRVGLLEAWRETAEGRIARTEARLEAALARLEGQR